MKGGAENAGVGKSGVDSRGGKCRSGRIGSRSQR